MTQSLLPILPSLLDNESAAFAMSNVAFCLPNQYSATYYLETNPQTEYPENFAEQLKEQINLYSQLRFRPEEITFLKEKLNLKPHYLDFLQSFTFDSQDVSINQRGNTIDITIKSLWYRAILWKTPLLTMINNLYYLSTNQKRVVRAKRQNNNLQKADFFYKNNIKMVDFGTNCRYSFKHQKEVLEDIISSYKYQNWFQGTTNMKMAFDLKLNPVNYMLDDIYIISSPIEKFNNVYPVFESLNLNSVFINFIHNDFNEQNLRLFKGAFITEQLKSTLEKYFEKIKSYKIYKNDKLVFLKDNFTTKKISKFNEENKSFKKNLVYCMDVNLTNDVGVRPIVNKFKIADLKRL